VLSLGLSAFVARRVGFGACIGGGGGAAIAFVEGVILSEPPMRLTGTWRPGPKNYFWIADYVMSQHFLHVRPGGRRMSQSFVHRACAFQVSAERTCHI
jgi:hypothetical protein